MAFRVLAVLAGMACFLGLFWIVISLFAVHFIENGVDRHVISWAGVWRGSDFLIVGVVLGLISLAVRGGTAPR